MGLISDALRVRNRAVFATQWQGTLGNPQGSFESYARSGYGGNEIVYKCIDLRASSAAEPVITGRRLRRDKATVRAQTRHLKAKGLSRAEINASLVRNKFVEETPDHPAVRLLNAPNPFMSRGQLWGTVVMDRDLSGNAYLLKVRSKLGPVMELWRLRPDRVRVIPSATNFIEGYEYRAGSETITYPKEDIIHFKTRNPLNDYYGMPVLMTIAGRIDIDTYMRTFLRSFFESGGTGPGAILNVKGRMSDDDKKATREWHRTEYGAGKGATELMIIDQTEATYTQMGLNRGLRDALPKEINDVQEVRIAIVFGIPGSILGLLVGYESSSYANKRADWQVFWDVTMAPLLSDLDDVLNLAYVSDFGGIDEVYFDLDDIKALQEDVDLIHERERKNFQVGGISFEEFRDAIGRDPEVSKGTFFIPVNFDVREFSELAADPREAEPETEPSEPVMPMEEEHDATMVIPGPRCPKCKRRNGANVNVGAILNCARCREDFVVSQNGHEPVGVAR